MERIKGTITSLAFGGEGIIRHENLVVFVPFTAVGDFVLCEIHQRQKNFARAHVIEILDPSLERAQPRCPYFGTCGGCQLQHLNYAAQLNYKRQTIEDTLKRIGSLTLEPMPDVIPATIQWAYRRHVTLTLKPNPQGTFSAGYIAVDNVSLLKVKECPIFVTPSTPILTQMQDFANRLICSSPEGGRAMILKQEDDQKYLIALHFPTMPSNGAQLAAECISAYDNWAGVILKSRKNTHRFGIAKSNFTLEGFSLSYSPEAFIQNHPEQSLNIYKSIFKIVREVNPDSILDLYCGIGITTLLMAQGGRKVVGVESNGEAIQLAKENAALNQINTAFFIKGDVKQRLPELLKKETPSLVVINPPREGMEKGIVDIFNQHPVEHLLYISCMPATLARDLKALSAEGYKVIHCQGYDMFPQTAHVETVVHLKR